MRAGTENVASIVGMAAALKNNCRSLEANQKHLSMLEEQLLRRLSEHGITFIRNGSTHSLPGLLSLSFPGQDGETILHRMDLMGISISTGSACDSKRTEISHVLRALQIPDMIAKGTIRISLGKNNTEREIDSISDALTKIIL